ncbi:MAG: hypothetical protein HYU69_01620 [Bacteroidetes bacterium]|nr:hypothetical protein [Bacteroidota bacterium]
MAKRAVRVGRNSQTGKEIKIAVASISTSIPGSISALTSIIVVTGFMSPKNSPCAWPTFCHCEISVTYKRVRTTSLNCAPASVSAFSILCRMYLVCK